MAHPAQYTKSFESICDALYNRDFAKAENLLMGTIKEMSTNAQLDDAMTMLTIYYKQFNHYYCEWVESQKGDSEKECSELLSDEHHNYLIAHCTDPAAMDDLLFELGMYIEDKSEQQKEEVMYHINCYRDALAAS